VVRVIHEARLEGPHPTGEITARSGDPTGLPHQRFWISSFEYGAREGNDQLRATVSSDVKKAAHQPAQKAGKVQKNRYTIVSTREGLALPKSYNNVGGNTDYVRHNQPVPNGQVWDNSRDTGSLAV